MAHVKKFTASSVGGLSIHVDRKTLNHSNEDIDVERTKLNYDLCEKEGDLQSRYQDRISEVYCMKRADVKSCASWVVTLPEELFENNSADQKKFFEATYDFLSARYGEKNVLSGMVHNDETTPHLHFAFVPVVYDEKKQREKVSAKLVLTRTELQNFHQDLDSYLKEKIPEIYQEGVLNGKTIGIDDVKVLKEKSLELESKKTALDKEITIVEESLKEVPIYKKPQAKFDLIKTGTQKLPFNRYILTNEQLKNIENLALAGVKRQFKVRDILANNQAEIKRLEKRVDSLQNDVSMGDMIIESRETALLESENVIAELKDLNIVLSSRLKDYNLNHDKPNELELNGRIILDKLEKGEEPQTKSQAIDWFNTLQKNIRYKIIPRGRLEGFLDKLKEIINKFVKREKEQEQPSFSVDYLRSQQQKAAKDTQRKNRREQDMER